jgi:enoyl-CoA hydratase/carnithine racemase
MSDLVLIEHRDDGVSTLTLNRPPLHLLDDSTLDAVFEGMTELVERDATRCILLTSTGERAFSGGHELSRAETTHRRTEAEAREDPGGIGRRIAELIEYAPKPVVCAAKGWVVGGSIAWVLASDVRIAAETVKFRYVDVRMGMAPAWGVTLARLVHYIGRNHALDFLLDPGDVDAARALELGLVTRVVPAADVDAEALHMAEILAVGAPLTLRAIKECTRAQYTELFPEAQRVQDDWLARIHASEDAKEGTLAWLDKRPPRFVGA